MKKLTVLLLTCLAGLPVFAQTESWKDSVKIKGKVTQAYYDDNVIYFRTKKGWGIYDRDQKTVLVQPVYQFVKRMGAGLQPGIFFVLQNKVGFMDLGYQVKDQPLYTRLGFAGEEEQLFRIVNDQVFYPNSTQQSIYPIHDNGTEYSVEVNNGRVYVNQHVKMLQRQATDGVTDDHGNPIYPEPEVDNRSMVFDLASGEWLVKKGEAAHVGHCRNNIVLCKEEVKDGRLSQAYSVINHEDKVTYRVGRDTVNNKKSISRILGDYHPVYLYSVDSSKLTNAFIFESGGKYGVYDPWRMRVILEPEYDFVYVPHENSKIFTVKNGKVGMTDPSMPQMVYENQYEQLGMHNLKREAEFSWYISCNGTSFEIDRAGDVAYDAHWKEKFSLDPTLEYLPVEEVLWATKREHEQAGLQVWKNKVLVHDGTPPYRETIMDMYTEEMLEVITPGHCHSGVFDPAAHKWTVPPKYNLVQASEGGYACKSLCTKSTSYSFFTREGKPVFENKPIDSLKKDVQALGKLMYPVQGQPRITWLPTVNEGNTCIVSFNNLYGVFDLLNLEWKVEPVHQLVDYNALARCYTVVDSGKIGILDVAYEPLVPALYSHIEFLSEGICANDTFLYSYEKLNLVAITDTLKTPEKFFASKIGDNLYLDMEIVGNKLYTGEEFFDPERVYYDEYGTLLDVGVLDTARTNITDLTNGSRVQFDKGWVLREWEKGYLTRDASGMIRAYDAKGKNSIDLYDKDSAGCNGKWFWYHVPDERFFYDPQGKIVQPSEVDLRYFTHNYQPVGEVYHYFDGNKMVKGPKGFVVMCASPTGLLLGYEVVTDPKTRLSVKKYRYYDPQTKQYSAVELELSDSPVKVFPVKDGFALLDYNRAEKQYNCTVLENDLRTVKSSFKKLTGYKTAKAYQVINPVPHYELYTSKKIMYFDRDFQFLHECNYQDKPESILKYNRFILKSKFKTIVMDWKGRILRQ